MHTAVKLNEAIGKKKLQYSPPKKAIPFLEKLYYKMKHPTRLFPVIGLEMKNSLQSGICSHDFVFI